jgi:hypothetical protein
VPSLDQVLLNLVHMPVNKMKLTLTHQIVESSEFVCLIAQGVLLRSEGTRKSLAKMRKFRKVRKKRYGC